MKGEILCVNIRNASFNLLTNEEIIKLLLIRATEQAGMTPVLYTLQVSHFPIVCNGLLKGGYGISAGMILVESHIYIHTWPEIGYARFELSSCQKIDAENVLKTITLFLGKDVSIEYKLIPWEDV